MNIRYPAPTLNDCDREPIHIIGAVQSFGGLLALNGDWIVAHKSANVSDVLAIDEAVGIGDKLDDRFSRAAMESFRSAAASLLVEDQVERMFAIDILGDGKLFDCALHTSGEHIVLEFEPNEEGAIERGMSTFRPLIAQLDAQPDIRSVADKACTLLRDLLGYDRVMMYRFRHDESGEVVAEAKRDDLESFLDLRYPRTDIPQQARELFLRNRFRIIADIDDEAVPIEPVRSLDGMPLDLSMSVLRAQSPIHVEYLRNMGVAASLSVSIVVDGKLWGLFALHHTEPRLPSFGMRTVAELFSEIVSLVIDRSLNSERMRQREANTLLHDRLMRSFADGDALITALANLSPIVGRAIDFDGVSLLIDGTYKAQGKAPSEEQFAKIVPRLNTSPAGRLIVTESLIEVLPEASCFADVAAGAIVLPISKRPRDFLVLWRGEEVKQVTWAGDPTKAVSDDGRLSPRKSFAAWQETMHGRSREWSAQDVQLAEGLRTTLLEIILRLTEDQIQERKRSQQQQELLIAELNHRVRNILNLIRGLISQSRGEATSIDEFSAIVGGRISSLASAHDNITKGNWSPASLRTLIDTELNAYIAGKKDRISIEGPPAMIDPEAYTVLALVIHEMVTNSAKYGSLSDGSGRLDIVIGKESENSLTIHWRETGGPPVKPPKRRGFGSTIVERSIPFELSGEAQVDYKLEGLEAHFVVPSRFVTWVEGEESGSVAPSQSRTEMDNPSRVPSKAMIVEDSIIIAMDTEDCLKELGVEHVMVESTVAGALSSLDKAEPAFAILDFNLGTESSEKVAETLRARGIPFWLATGYGEMADRLEEIGARGILTKPYGKDELMKLLSQFDDG